MIVTTNVAFQRRSLCAKKIHLRHVHETLWLFSFCATAFLHLGSWRARVGTGLGSGSNLTHVQKARETPRLLFFREFRRISIFSSKIGRTRLKLSSNLSRLDKIQQRTWTRLEFGQHHPWRLRALKFWAHSSSTRPSIKHISRKATKVMVNRSLISEIVLSTHSTSLRSLHRTNSWGFLRVMVTKFLTIA